MPSKRSGPRDPAGYHTNMNALQLLTLALTTAGPVPALKRDLSGYEVTGTIALTSCEDRGEFYYVGFTGLTVHMAAWGYFRVYKDDRGFGRFGMSLTPTLL